MDRGALFGAIGETTERLPIMNDRTNIILDAVYASAVVAWIFRSDFLNLLVELNNRMVHIYSARRRETHRSRRLKIAVITTV